MNNEPVAWMSEFGQFIGKVQDEICHIPLYTHPVKELSRELLDKTIIDQQNEIKELRKNLDVALMIVNKPKLTDGEIDELYADYQNPDYYSREVIFDQLGFARAILRKAQEK